MESQIKKGMWPCEGRLSLIHNENADALGLFCAIFPGEAVLSALSDKQSVRSMKIAMGNRAERIQTPVFVPPTNSLSPKMADQGLEVQTYVFPIINTKMWNQEIPSPQTFLVADSTLSTLCSIILNFYGKKCQLQFFSEPGKKIKAKIWLLKNSLTTTEHPNWFLL